MGITLDAFLDVDAVYMDEHFVLKSGKHSDRYINPDNILPHPTVLDGVTKAMAEAFASDVSSDDWICIGPDFGGNYLAHDVARHLGHLTGLDIPWVATKKQEDGSFIVEPDRGFEGWLNMPNVLVVEDLMTTGGSVQRLMEMLQTYGHRNVDGVCVAINRGGVTAEDLGVPRLFAAEEVQVETDEPRVCRWCAMQRSIVEDIGHGADFKRNNPDYAGGYKALLG